MGLLYPSKFTNRCRHDDDMFPRSDTLRSKEIEPSMSEIFISHQREDQEVARKIANALETEGWTVWWDPKLRAGEHFDEVIEEALTAAKCVVVLWSAGSVKSQYVRDEATYALECKKLVPVAIEAVEMPFRFRGVHTLRLFAWDGSRDSTDFRKLVDDISTILDESSKIIRDYTEQAQDERLQEQERQRPQEEIIRRVEEASRTRVEPEALKFWRIYGSAAAAVVLIIFSVVMWWPRPQQKETFEQPRTDEKTVVRAPPTALGSPKQIIAPTQKKVESTKEMESQAPLRELKQEKAIATPPLLSPGRAFRDRLKTGGDGPEMVVVQAGSFKMGDIQGGGEPDERPVRDVRIKRFAIGRYEVAFEEYDKFAKSLPDDRSWGRDRRPVIYVSQEDAVAYAQWLSLQTGNRYRLPSEAEWEYAARGGKETTYWWGEELMKGMANCNGCGSQWDKKQTAPVGSFKPNSFGLYDTAGNVWEWVADCWHGNYQGAPTDGSAWLRENGGDCGQRVIRGASWGAKPADLRSSNRGRYSRGIRNLNLGFRLVREID